MIPYLKALNNRWRVNMPLKSMRIRQSFTFMSPCVSNRKRAECGAPSQARTHEPLHPSRCSVLRIYELSAKSLFLTKFRRKLTSLKNLISFLIYSSCSSVLISFFLLFWFLCRAIGLMSSELAHGPRDWGSIPGRSHTKDSKMVLEATLLNTQHCKSRIKGKVEQSREWSGRQLLLF